MKIEKLQIGYVKTLLEVPLIELELGKVYALVGANGRGKTTLLQTLIGTQPALSGKVEIDGENLTKLSANQKSKTLGFVRSRFDGVSYMRAQEFVALGRLPFTNALGRLSKKDVSIVKESIKTMELEHLSEKFTTELSDGERQMLAIAKVLAQGTPYIFLDEPTAFLDYSNKKRVLQLLVKIAQEQNKCILFSSHDLEMTFEYADEILYVSLDCNEIKQIAKGNFTLSKLIENCF